MYLPSKPVAHRGPSGGHVDRQRLRWARFPHGPHQTTAPQRGPRPHLLSSNQMVTPTHSSALTGVPVRASCSVIYLMSVATDRGRCHHHHPISFSALAGAWLCASPYHVQTSAPGQPCPLTKPQRLRDALRSPCGSTLTHEMALPSRGFGKLINVLTRVAPQGFVGTGMDRTASQVSLIYANSLSLAWGTLGACITACGLRGAPPDEI